ncbi:caffeic acid 3-O-methyltransferase-like [Sesamum indicum]|uniref:Caffeic acid 3-O-methyltransferase-like n=1 Tax=Sesamum indicum TaxID=4182 RepID=A0A6I9SJ82_SESIN|nr:caffeic acid 3-O-methyltransferase-like [Sesamum indicum]
MENYKHGEDEEAGVLALAACVSHIFPMALDAAIQLDLFEIIARAGGGAQLSASDIVCQLPTSHDGAAAVLDSLLRLLATHSFLTCSVNRLENGGTERRYGLAPAGKFFVGDENGVSFAQLRAMTGLIRKHFSLKDAVLEGGNLTETIYKKSNYEVILSNPEITKVMYDAMKAHSTVLMKKIVQVYDGFSSLSSIVDVGGCTGAAVGIIVAKYPHIKGINFDLPQVVKNAPSYNGVEHIGGDMFVQVPKGDVILLKHILHNWNDEKCIKLLKNCYKALPDKGKLIVMDYILSNNPKTDVHAKYASGMDIIMLMNLEGKERTTDEFETLATKAEFTEFKVVCDVYGMWIMELMKSI